MVDDSAHGAKAAVSKGSPSGYDDGAAAALAAAPRFNVPVDSENK